MYLVCKMDYWYNTEVLTRECVDISHYHGKRVMCGCACKSVYEGKRDVKEKQ